MSHHREVLPAILTGEEVLHEAANDVEGILAADPVLRRDMAYPELDREGQDGDCVH